VFGNLPRSLTNFGDAIDLIWAMQIHFWPDMLVQTEPIVGAFH
jgi:hypothetical protein